MTSKCLSHVHVLFILCLCYVYVIFMLSLCQVYYKFMSCLCYVYVMFLSCFLLNLYYVFVMFMLCLCYIYVMFMSIVLCLPDGWGVGPRTEVHIPCPCLIKDNYNLASSPIFLFFNLFFFVSSYIFISFL